jgi:transcription elongation factor Elf1
MADVNRRPESVLPIQCPHCEHALAKLFVNSYSVVTVTCVSCGHTWSIEMAALPTNVQQVLPDVARRARRASERSLVSCRVSRAPQE